MTADGTTSADGPVQAGGPASADGPVPGIESVPRLARWLAAHGVPAAVRLPSVHLIAGGRSNLTYRLEFPAPSDPGRLVLRRPPLGHVLPTAHDMTREYRLISALHGTSIPVARPVAFCSDTEIVGAPFYVMEYVDGVVVRTRDQAAMITPEQARLVSERLAEMLAAIHQLDVASAGLGDFGRPEGYLRRQLSRWQRQWELSASRDVPGYAELVARLEAGLPETSEGTLVHGDFRLDNVLLAIGADPRITAVVDWEMATLGDPLADLALTLVYWADPEDTEWADVQVGATATSSPWLPDQGRVRGQLCGEDRPRPVRHWLLHGVRLLQAGGRARGDQRQVPAAQDGGGGFRPGRQGGPGADRARAPHARLGSAVTFPAGRRPDRIRCPVTENPCGPAPRSRRATRLRPRSQP